MKTLIKNRNIIVSIFVVMLFVYGLQGISFADSTHIVKAGETNTSIKVSVIDLFWRYDKTAYQVQLRRKSPQGEWITQCMIGSYSNSPSVRFNGPEGIPIEALPLPIWVQDGVSCDCFYGEVAFSFTDLEPGVTYEARYRDTRSAQCIDNPPKPLPWSDIIEATTHSVAPPRAEFVDPVLARQVRKTLKLDVEGGHIELLKIPTTALEKLTVLENRNRIVRNITGLEHAHQLTKLILHNNVAINDISPLAGLTQLTELDLSENDIRDISNLAQLTKLDRLSLTSNEIVDISSIAQLTHLTKLYLSNNKIRNIAALAPLTLSKLSLHNNLITDITPLTQWTDWSFLTLLDLSNNLITDITPLLGLINSAVEKLNLSNNRISDISPLAKLADLTNLKYLDLEGNPFTDVTPLNILLEANPDVRIYASAMASEDITPEITVSPDDISITELDSTLVKLYLNRGFYNFSFTEDREDIYDGVKLSGITGAQIVKKTVDSELSLIEFELQYYGIFLASDSILTISLSNDLINGYNGPDLTFQIPVTGVTRPDELAEYNDQRIAFESNTPSGYTAVYLTTNGRVWGHPSRYTKDSNIGKVAFLLLGQLKECGFVSYELARWSSVYIKKVDVEIRGDYGSVASCDIKSFERSGAFDPIGNRITHLRFFDKDSPPYVKEAVYNESTREYEVKTVEIELPTEPMTDAIVSITPASVASPPVGEQITFNLNIADGETVAGYQATVQFDDTALSYVSAVNGDFLPAGAFFVTPVIEGNLVKLNAASLSGETEGDGALATVTFEVINAIASTLTLSDVVLTNSAGDGLIPHLKNAEISEPTGLKEDINGDGIVNIQDLVLVASNLGKTGQNAADVNVDGVVNIQDLVLVAGALGTGAAAPALFSDTLSTLTAADVKGWLTQAQHLNLTDATSLRGVQFLQQLLQALTPKKTALLPNYPNPFNPETWIPYHLSKDADVTLHIYAMNGTLVRTLSLGYQPAGMYQYRNRAAYWDGKNEYGEKVASGLYFYTFTAGDFSATRKMLILK